MNDQSQDFEQLRRLLALKRHETPPPGYFQDFSSRVIGRIEGEAEAETGLFQRVIKLLQIRPAISASFCLASVLVLLAAATLIESGPASSPVRMPNVQPKFAVVAGHSSVADAPASGAVFITNFGPAGFAIEMAPPHQQPVATNSSLFESPLLRVEPVTYNH